MALDVESIRKDFPILNRTVNGRRLVYLDNAATSQRPIQVIKAMREYSESLNANVHRGVHFLSSESSKLYEDAHEIVAKHINASSWREVVFTLNTTYAVNLVAIPLVKMGLLRGRKKIIVSEMEHHSNMLPWREAAKLLGAEVLYARVDKNGYLNTDALLSMLDENVSVLALTQASNVTGIINPVKEIFALAKKLGIITFMDAAQSIPHIQVNVKELNADFIVFSGHKMLGPFGIGVLYGRLDILEELEPVFTGGGTIKDVTLREIIYAKPPNKFEAGTPNVEGAIGLAEAIKYLERVGKSAIHEHEKMLVRMTRKLLKEIDGVVLYPEELKGDFTGTLAFNIQNVNPHIVGKVLSDFYGIAIRTGLHCAHPYHYAIGANDGTARASFYLYNTEEEAEYLAQSLEEANKKYFKKMDYI